MFQGWNVRAILAGTKTQTRRIVKPQPTACPGFSGHKNDLKWDVADGIAVRTDEMCARYIKGKYRKPYGDFGDRLWVKETYSLNHSLHYGHVSSARIGGIIYRASWPKNVDHYDRKFEDERRWRSPRFMSRQFSRLLLEITEVRVQRVQEISDADARVEGLSQLTKDGGRTWKFGLADRDGLPGNDDDGWHWQDWETNPVTAYARLWDRINGKGSWDANPFVWALTFRVVQPTEVRA